MLNFSTKSLPEKYLKRNLPPCNCTQCELLRTGNNPEQHVNNLCAKIARAYQSDRNEEEKNYNFKPDSKLNLQLEVESEDIMDCVRVTRHSNVKETDQSESKASMEHKSQENYEQSNGNSEEAKSKEDITELSNENLEEAKPEQSNESLKEGKPQQSNESLKEADPIQDIMEQFDESLKAITSAEKVADKQEQFGIRRIFKVSSFTLPSFNFKPDNLQYFFFEIVDLVAFFTMMTALFWVKIAQSSWHFIKIILRSGKRAQLVTLILFLLLCASITFHAIRGRNHLRDQQNAQITNEPPERPPVKWPSKCHHKCCEHIRHNLMNAQNLNENIVARRDSSSSLYSVSNEIITPPFVECVDETVTGIFNRITRSIANFFSRYVHHM